MQKTPCPHVGKCKPGCPYWSKKEQRCTIDDEYHKQQWVTRVNW